MSRWFLRPETAFHKASLRKQYFDPIFCLKVSENLKTSLFVNPETGALSHLTDQGPKTLSWQDYFNLPGECLDDIESLIDSLDWPSALPDLAKQCGLPLSQVDFRATSQENIDRALDQALKLMFYPHVLRCGLFESHRAQYLEKHSKAKQQRRAGRKELTITLESGLARSDRTDWAIHALTPDRSACLVLVNPGISIDTRWRWWGLPTEHDGVLTGGAWIRHDVDHLSSPTQWADEINLDLDVIEQTEYERSNHPFKEYQPKPSRFRTWKIYLPHNSEWIIEAGPLLSLQWPGKPW